MFGGPVYLLKLHTGFFSTFFRLCSAYITFGPSLSVNSEKWGHGSWSWYFTSLRESRLTPLSRIITSKTEDVNSEKWLLGDFRRAVRTLFRVTPAIQMEIERVVHWIGTPYTAIFVRRGDKVSSGEAPYIPMSEILSQISYTETTAFFIQSDDYTVVEEMRSLLPTHRIYSIVPPTKRGSYHSDKHNPVGTPWSRKTIEQAKIETVEMLVGLSVCLRAEHCWTDDTSNVGRFLKLYDDRVRIYPNDYSVDESKRAHPSWTIRS